MQKIKTIDASFYRVLGNKIRKAREKKNITQRELAKEIGISRTQLISYEYGYTKMKPSIFAKICVALETQINDVFVEMR